MKLPIRTQTFLLDGDYVGFEFEARVNPPWGEFIDKIEAIEKADQNQPQEVLARLYDLVRVIAVSWNFVDEVGKTIPLSPAGLRKIPLELLQMIILRAREVIERVPLAPSGGSLSQSVQGARIARLNISKQKSAEHLGKSPTK